MRTILNKLNSTGKDRVPLAEILLPPNKRQSAQNKPITPVYNPTTKINTSSSGGMTGGSVSSGGRIPTSDVTGSRGLVSQNGGSSSTGSHIPISDVTGSRGLVSQTGGSSSSGSHIPISDVTGSRGLFSQRNGAANIVGSDNTGDTGSGKSGDKASYIPISVVTSDRDVATLPERLRNFIQQNTPSTDSYIPDEYASLADVMEQTVPEFSFEDWADKTTKQQLAAVERSGLSAEDQMTLLNAPPHYVETIATVQALYANRTSLGLTVTQLKALAGELFDIANERDEAINRTGKYENDARFAPKALRWLDERENELLEGIVDNTNEDGQDTWYNGENSDPLYDFSDSDSSVDFHRQAKYADIDEEAATRQIEDLLMKNVAEAEEIAARSGIDGDDLAATSAQLAWFYQNVKKNSPTDYKNPAIWYRELPGLPYPEEDKVYHVFGYTISSSDLGNLNYALVGKALGIPEDLLLQQAGAAQLRDHKGYGQIKSQIKSIELRDQGYGDEDDDQDMIKKGFIKYNRLD